MLHAGHESIGGVHCGDAVDTGLDSGTADQEAVSGLVAALGRGIDDKVDLVSQDQVHNSRGFLRDLVDLSRLHTCFIQSSCGTSGSINGVSQLFEASSDFNGFTLIRILHGDDHVLILGQFYACSQECLVQSLIEGLGDTQTLTGRLHLRS